MAVKFEQTALRVPTVSRSFSRIVMDTAVFFLASGTVFAKDDSGDFCTQTTRAAFNACQYEAADDFWIAKGNCHNRSDPHARAECEEKTIVARRTKLQECRVRRQGRSGVCKALGEAPYDPLIDPAMFVDPSQIGKAIAPNPYFLLVPGRTMVYKKEHETIRVTVTGETRVILGVTCAVVHDVVTENGVIVEDTLDWYAQDIRGNVWYFGEISQTLEDGVLVSIDGSWTAGVDGAKPGIANKVNPAVGDVYRQEFALNTAEDMGEVVSLTGSANLPVASCRGKCVVIKDFSSISPNSLEHKYYAPGIGFILETKPGITERLELVEVIQK